MRNMMKKIYIIEPKAPNLHIFSRFHLPRLGGFILASLARDKGWQAEVIIEHNKPLNFNVMNDAALIGISTITSTAPRAYAIADKIRSLGIPVIMGGPHVTFLADEALEHCDYVIRGEAEEAFPMFLDAWENKTDFSAVPALSYHNEDQIRHNQAQKERIPMNKVPIPDYNQLMKAVRSVAGKRTIPVQTSRGCPFNCSFCSVTGMFGKQYRFRPVDDVIEELMRYDSRRNEIFFYDDNFAANLKHTKELLRRMIKERFRFTWSTQVRVEVAKDEELMTLMKKAGCRTLYIGFESINPASLKLMKKQQSVEDIRRCIRILRKYSIHIHGMFVFGFDEDTPKTVEATVRFARKEKINTSQFLILTPLPGSEFFSQMKENGRLTFTDWNLYDAHHAVFKPAHFSIAELQQAQIKSHARFYSLRESFARLLRGRLIDLAIAHYARDLNRAWKKKNRLFLKTLELITPRKEVDITVQYRQKVLI